jgi:hypothetical protein
MGRVIGAFSLLIFIVRRERQFHRNVKAGEGQHNWDVWI